MLTKLDRFLGRMKIRGPRDLWLVFAMIIPQGVLMVTSVFRGQPSFPVVAATSCMAFLGMFVVCSYAALSVILCTIGIVSPILINSRLVGWGISVPSIVLGLVCAVRYLVWRDRYKNHHYTTL